MEEQREWIAGGGSRKASSDQATMEQEGEEKEEEEEEEDKLVIYKQILALLQPGETVVKVTKHNSKIKNKKQRSQQRAYVHLD